tara:strand:- start:1685 stop:1900 length:216 start_codon:yes stop_codon:yes gene_type:complete
MAKGIGQTITASVINVVTNVAVVAVGFGMVSKVLTIPNITVMVTQVAGWVLVVLGIVGIIATIFSLVTNNS